MREVRSIAASAQRLQNSMVLPSFEFDEGLMISATRLEAFMSLDVALREKVLQLASMMKSQKREIQTVLEDPEECVALEKITASIELDVSSSSATAMWIPSAKSADSFAAGAIDRHRKEVAQASLYEDSGHSGMSHSVIANNAPSSGLQDLLLICYDGDSYSTQRIARVCIDNEAPQLSTSGSWCSINDMPHEGCVSVSLEHWEGYLPNVEVPFIGYMRGDVRALYVDNKRVYELKEGRFFFRKTLYLRGGYNEFEVKAVDRLGNISKGVVSTTTESTSDIDIDLNNYDY